MLKWLAMLLVGLARMFLRDAAVVVVDRVGDEARELGEAVAREAAEKAREAAAEAARQVVEKEEVARRREAVRKQLGV